jgi:hypothetical protein
LSSTELLVATVGLSSARETYIEGVVVEAAVDGGMKVER